MYRAPTARHARVAGAFIDWGIPTAVSLQYCRQEAPELPLFASGGIHDGIEVAKCIALGASAVGLAGEFLRAADQNGVAGVVELAGTITDELCVTMFCAGYGDITALSAAELHQSF
jgi:isopentenyl-diphosphate delta-isomerase